MTTDEIAPTSIQLAVDEASGHRGISLWPQPTADPKDPLRWPRRTKVVAAVLTSLANFTANFSGAGLSVAITLLQQQFDKTPNQINALLTFNFLFLGVGNVVWVPVASKLGKRFSLLLSLVGFFASLIWTAKADSYEELLAARSISALFGAAGESLVPEIINNLLFLHERATMMTFYAVCLSLSNSIGPLLAGFIVTYSANNWRDFAWLSAGMGGFNLVSVFLFYPESTFHRPNHASIPTQPVSGSSASRPDMYADTKTAESPSPTVSDDAAVVESLGEVPVEWSKVWTSFVAYDRSVSTIQAIWHPYAFLLYPDIIWVVSLIAIALTCPLIPVYGTMLLHRSHSSSANVSRFGLPGLLTGPPYFFQPFSVGVLQMYQVYPNLVTTAVMNVDDSLVAFVKPSDCDIETLRKGLIQDLQPSWVQQTFVPLNEIPLTANHNIDYQRLAELGFGNDQTVLQGPYGVEVAGIWRDLLKPPVDAPISREDDFVRIGGHSVLQMLLAARLQSTYGIKLSIRQIVSRPTLRAQAESVKR
ncbi:Nonribosomal peptide synthetase-like protein [Elsinoe fawcettii]|nr:Nonribosomal peptide synthetase-like protein [Elsinoe fawcettii]